MKTKTKLKRKIENEFPENLQPYHRGPKWKLRADYRAPSPERTPCCDAFSLLNVASHTCSMLCVCCAPTTDLHDWSIALHDRWISREHKHRSIAQASVDRATIDRSRSAIYGSVAGFMGGALSNVQLFLQQFLHMIMIWQAKYQDPGWKVGYMVGFNSK